MAGCETHTRNSLATLNAGSGANKALACWQHKQDEAGADETREKCMLGLSSASVTAKKTCALECTALHYAEVGVQPE